MSFGYKVLGFGAGGAGPAFGITATGGTETLDGAFKVHTFTANGNFIVAALGTDVTFGSKVEYLVVAGGAGGGMSGHGGGGGAGGYRCSVPGESSGGGASAESTLTVVGNTPYTITVGAGGAGADSPSSTTNGGSGVVITKEPEVSFISGASGIWSLDEVYDFVKAGTWTN